MKSCLTCRTAFAQPGWRCPNCGFEPEIRDGFPSFAPDLARQNDGMPDNHAALDRLQERNFWFRARNRLLAMLARRFAGTASKAFEVGCGTGYVLHGLRAALPAAEFSGAEIFTSGLVHADRRLGGAAQLMQMDARAIPFDDEFDLIGAFDVLEHIEEDGAALLEMRRALRPGGTLMLAVPQHMWLWSGIDDISFHKRRYRRGELESKVAAAGFTVLLSTSFVVMLLPAMLASRRSSGGDKARDPAREFMLPGWLNALFERCLDLERLAIGAGVRFPIGGSRVVVARRA